MTTWLTFWCIDRDNLIVRVHCCRHRPSIHEAGHFWFPQLIIISTLRKDILEFLVIVIEMILALDAKVDHQDVQIERIVH
ncbi:hypothetical protein OUZ56_011975 [Daphnia magna]|uniref:Uncharacterized protein n=1 Tax=Daphnia magna TaxID=35525 RepID=A0ABQ9Z1N0_9CRUS|nr:hypothetical protein OUZ56_011975 [Daphnia magna]